MRRVILPSRLISLAEQGHLSLLIRSTRERGPQLRVGHAYPLQVRKRAVDHQGFPRRRRRPDPVSGLSVETDEDRFTVETRCYAKVTQVEDKHAHEATDQEAKAAGFPGGRWEFWRWWKETYDEWPADQVRGQLLVFDTPARFVWIELDEMRHLAVGTAVPSDARGYVRSAGSGMRGEMQAVEESVQDRISAGELRSDAARAFDATSARQRELQRREMHQRVERLRGAQALALQRDDVDISEQVARIDEQIASIQRSLGQT